MTAAWGKVERYSRYDRYAITGDSWNASLTVRECLDCGVIVADRDKHDAYHEFLSTLTLGR